MKLTRGVFKTPSKGSQITGPYTGVPLPPTPRGPNGRSGEIDENNEKRTSERANERTNEARGYMYVCKPRGSFPWQEGEES